MLDPTVMDDLSVSSKIEAHLLQHPGVNEVMVRQENGTNPKFAAFVVPDFSALGGDPLVDRWKKIYEVTYSAGPAAPSFVGWASSYTRRPMPDAEMQEWLQATVTRIQSLKPHKILEIGCGVGLLVQQLAPSVAEYVATDISGPAVDRLRQWVRGRQEFKHVDASRRCATDLGHLQAAHFDTVILNSVVQYFPNIDYLRTVLRDAVKLVRPGGRVFVGDIRNLRLLRIFHSAVQLNRAPPALTARELRKRIARVISQEIELVIDPAFFTNLAEQNSSISSVDVQLRRGSSQNELTRYRYDAILHVGGEQKVPCQTECKSWQELDESLTSLETLLHHRHPSALRIVSIPNRRLSIDAAAAAAIEAADDHLTVERLREQMSSPSNMGADPHELWALGELHGYEARVGWSSIQFPTHFDVEWVDRTAGWVPLKAALPADRISEYSNNPLENSLSYRFTEQLRQYLLDRVPEAMIPSEWTILRNLPRTPDGVSKQALRGL